MSPQELIILIIILSLCVLGLYCFRYILRVLKIKIEAFKRGEKSSKRTRRLINRMQRYGQVRFLIFQGIIFWGLYFSVGVTLLGLLFDFCFDHRDICIVDSAWSLLRIFIIFSISGLIYARAAWKAYH